MDVLTTWEKAIAATDGVEQPEATVTRLKRFFTEAGCSKPLDAVGIVKVNLVNGQEGVKWPTNGAHLAMTRRVLKYVNAVQEAHQLQQTRKAATTIPGASDSIGRSAPGTDPLSVQTRQEQHMRMLGNDPSASALAAALDCAKDASVLDVKKKLAGKGFADMPYHLVADSAAFQWLTAHGKQAEKNG